jgi:hypothetical protein
MESFFAAFTWMLAQPMSLQLTFETDGLQRYLLFIPSLGQSLGPVRQTKTTRLEKAGIMPLDWF